MSTPWPVVALIAILGLAIGSFLNVVVYRVPRKESVVSPGSHCPRCDTPIKGRHNVPVLGWLMLRGRCASCRLGISARYPLVEGGTALLFAALTLRFGISAQLPAFLFLAAVAITLALIDFDAQQLPDSLLMPSYIVAVALLVPAGAADDDWQPFARCVAGGLLLVTMFFAFELASSNSVDLSTAKLAGLLGIYLAWISWTALLLVALAAIAISAASRNPLALTTPRGLRAAAVPLAPCLIAATVLTIFFAAPISAWYSSLLAV